MKKQGLRWFPLFPLTRCLSHYIFGTLLPSLQLTRAPTLFSTVGACSPCQVYPVFILTEYTQSGNYRFLAYIPSWWKNQPRLVRVGSARPPPFTLLPSRTKLQCTLQLRGQRYTPTISCLPYMNSVVILTSLHVLHYLKGGIINNSSLHEAKTMQLTNGHALNVLYCAKIGNFQNGIVSQTLKGLSHEIDFKNFDQNLKNLV